MNQRGQNNFQESQQMDSLHPWGLLNTITKADAWIKLGKVNQLYPWRSTAIQISGSIYNQNARYGLNLYDGSEKSLYVNFLHNGRLGNEKHEYKAGISYLYDNYAELLNANQFLRKESVPGAFVEYAYKPSDKLGIGASSARAATKA